MEIKDGYNNYVIELREIDNTQTITILNNQSTRYIVIRKDIFYILTLSQ